MGLSGHVGDCGWGRWVSAAAAELSLDGPANEHCRQDYCVQAQHRRVSFFYQHIYRADRTRQQPPRRPRPDDELNQRPPPGQLFDPRRHDPMRFAALTHQKPPPAPSTSGHSSTSLSDARSLASSAFTLTSGTSASSASITGPNSPLTQAAPTNPFLAQLKKTYRELCAKESRIVKSSPDDGDDDEDGSTRAAGVPAIVEPHSVSGEDVWLRRVKDHKE